MFLLWIHNNKNFIEIFVNSSAIIFIINILSGEDGENWSNMWLLECFSLFFNVSSMRMKTSPLLIIKIRRDMFGIAIYVPTNKLRHHYTRESVHTNCVIITPESLYIQIASSLHQRVCTYKLRHHYTRESESIQLSLTST